MLHIGCHLSSSKGFAAMGETAASIGADTFAFFTRNPRGGSAKAADPADGAALMKLCQSKGFARLVAHAPYTMNLCSADGGLRDFALSMMKDDMARMELIPGNYYNFHPGSHTGQGVERGIGFRCPSYSSMQTPESRRGIRCSSCACAVLSAQLFCV